MNEDITKKVVELRDASVTMQFQIADLVDSLNELADLWSGYTQFPDDDFKGKHLDDPRINDIEERGDDSGNYEAGGKYDPAKPF